MADALPLISVVINTYNRGAWIDDALRGLRGLDYPEFEVIVVNGPSTDHSAVVIAGWAPAIKSRDCPVANLAVSRNIGIGAASGDIIAFIDDDAVPHPQWLRQLALRYDDPHVGAVGGFTVDNTGTDWQMRKVLCDRFGNTHRVSDYFDERGLNRPGSPYYPSLLGTNASFRATALRAIGGFDHAFAYLLDETDVCLRLVDAGWHVVYAPEALVWHQFAPSHIRSPGRVARTLYPSSVSKGYFVARHGSAADLRVAARELDGFRRDILASNAGLEQGGDIDAIHRHVLDEDMLRGLDAGRTLAMRCGAQPWGHLQPGEPSPVVRFARGSGRRVVLVSQGWPPLNEHGIARWTALLAHGLVARGHHVHVLTRADGPEETIHFVHGMWVHRLIPDAQLAPGAHAHYGLPENLAAWAMRVWREAQFLKSFGIELISFPIWDLEGLPLLDDPDLTTVVSLHTTYAMARAFKPEWRERPIYDHAAVQPVIAAERAVLARAPHLLANSQAIIDEIATLYDLDIAARTTLVPHGTPDPLIAHRFAAEQRNTLALTGAPLIVLFVGRFEPRKGFDIAVGVAQAVTGLDGAAFHFAGGVVDDAARATIAEQGADPLIDHPRCRFLGVLDRAALDRAYAAADVVLMPSRFESFGLVAIEAMAAGRPVIALDAGGLGEIAVATHGARAFPDGPGVVSAMVEELARLDADRIELRRRGNLARSAWETHYSVNAMVEGIEAFFEQVVDRSGVVGSGGVIGSGAVVGSGAGIAEMPGSPISATPINTTPINTTPINTTAINTTPISATGIAA